MERVRVALLAGVACFSVACGFTFDESFEKEVRLKFSQDRALCANETASGVELVAADRVIEGGEGEARCYWDAATSGSVCTLTVRCAYDIPLDKIKDKLEGHEDQVADKLDIKTLEGHVRHVSFYDRSGQPIHASVGFTVRDIEISLAELGVALTKQNLIDPSSYEGVFVPLFQGDEIVVAPGSTFDFSASGTKVGIDLALDVFADLPDTMPGGSKMTVEFDLDNGEVAELLGALDTWELYVEGEVSAEVSLR